MEESQSFLCIVDDDPDTCQLLAEQIESDLYETKIFTCPREGLAFLAQHKPFGIILDYYMPVMNGSEFCAEAQKLGVEQGCVVMMSSWPPESGRIPEGIEKTVRYFLEKPDALERLPLIVSQLYDERYGGSKEPPS
ncbi:MAG: response regulator [Oligoflexales bacterium]